MTDMSLVICTRNREKQLAKALASVARLRCATSWDLVVVDNASTDDTPSVIQRFAVSHGAKMLLELRRGTGAAKNTGWRASQGDIVVFTDDDCYPDEDFLLSIARSFEEDPGLGFVGGRVLLHDPEAARITIKESQLREDFLPGDFMYPGALHGANFAFRRCVLEGVDGFDERFGPGAIFPAAEDTDILARALALGWRGAYDPRIVVYHDHGRRTGSQVSGLARNYNRGRGAYYVKCIVNPRMRYVYAKHWYWAMRRQSIRVTISEATAGVEFLLRSAAESFRNFRRVTDSDLARARRHR